MRETATHRPHCVNAAAVPHALPQAPASLPDFLPDAAGAAQPENGYEWTYSVTVLN